MSHSHAQFKDKRMVLERPSQGSIASKWHVHSLAWGECSLARGSTHWPGGALIGRGERSLAGGEHSLAGEGGSTRPGGSTHWPGGDTRPGGSTHWPKGALIGLRGAFIGRAGGEYSLAWGEHQALGRLFGGVIALHTVWEGSVGQMYTTKCNTKTHSLPQPEVWLPPHPEKQGCSLPSSQWTGGCTSINSTSHAL